MSNFVINKILTADIVNPLIKTMHYAPRGPISILAAKIQNDLKEGKKSYPFKRLILANIGDAQAMGQQPITFIRQVLAGVELPALLDSNVFPMDVRQRAQNFLNSCNGNSSGSYAPCDGIHIVRKHVAEFIQKRDGFECDYENVFFGTGAAESIRNVLNLFMTRETKKSGVMIPIPQYPLYSAYTSELNIEAAHYYLNEEKNWSLDLTELERSYEENQKKCNIRAIVIINPGNPTGQVLSRSNIQEIIKFAYEKKLFILADEVYQENIYDDCQFYSFKKIACEMPSPYNRIELASFNSCSKGYIGECGTRGAYVEFLNLDAEVLDIYRRMIAATIHGPIIGQACLECLVNPPQPEEPSYELWLKEKSTILNSLKEKALMITKTFNTIEGISVNEVQGAMYAFPRLNLPQKAIDIAKSKNIEPDFFYVKELLKETGVCMVPGSGFGQQPGTYHFRTTILPQLETFKDMLQRFTQFHINFMKKYS